MPRTREFDADEALAKAMHLFWQRGYADTSVRDLVAHTGVAHAGLYAAFGDKRALFARALAHYQEMIAQMFYADLEAPDAGLPQIEAFFRKLASAIAHGKFANGCLIANTGVEFAAHPGPEQDTFLANLERLTRAFEAALNHAQQNGDIEPHADPKQLAAGLAATFHGLSVLARAGAATAAIDNAVDATLDQLK